MIERELKSFHTEANTEYYRRNNDMSFHKKYIWDGKNSMDSLLRGWVPRELFQILRKHINQKKKVENILIRWVVKLNKWFFNRIWKKRNEKVIECEMENNITNKDKKKSLKESREIRFEKMKRVKEKRNMSSIDTYYEVRQLCFFSKMG